MGGRTLDSPGIGRLRLLLGRPSRSDVAARVLRLAYLVESALDMKWCPGWSAVLLGAVVSVIGLLRVHSGGSVGPAMATVPAREGDPRECASSYDLAFRSFPGQDCPELPTPVAALGGALRSGGSWRSRPLAVHSLCSTHDATVGDTLGGYGHIANS